MHDPKVFVSDSNNNTIAVMEKAVYDRRIRADVTERDTIGPIFLFRPDGLIDLQGREPWITGDYSLMNRLLAGHVVVYREIWIPFSNGHQLYDTREALLSNVRLSGSVAEAMEVFGLIPSFEIEPAVA